LLGLCFCSFGSRFWPLVIASRSCFASVERPPDSAGKLLRTVSEAP
jgi:hypothetical protein